MYVELALYWTSILETLPELRKEPVKMRNHSIMTVADRGDDRDHLLFWPLGQLLLATLVRSLFDQAGISATSNLAHCKVALEPLSQTPWDLDAAPWRNLILVPKEDKWVMRNANRKEAVNIAIALLTTFMHPNFTPNKEQLLELKKACSEYLVFSSDENNLSAAVDSWWSETLMNLGVKV